MKLNNQITPPEDYIIRFEVGDEVILIIDKDGLEYKGKRVDDAGEAQKAFVQTMAILQNSVQMPS